MFQHKINLGEQSREMAHEAAKCIRAEVERIPDELREDVFGMIAHAEDLQDWLDVFIDGTEKESAKRIQDITDLEQEIRGIIEAARQAYALRETDASTGLKQLIKAIRQTKEHCEKRKNVAQMLRSAEAMKEIEAFGVRRNQQN